MQTQSIESLLDAKVREYKEILDKKDELADATQANNAAEDKLGAGNRTDDGGQREAKYRGGRLHLQP